MPEEDASAGEVDHAEIVVGVILPAGDDAAEVVEPGKEAFDLPASSGAAERPAILCTRPPAAIGGDHLDAVGGQQRGVERVAVVSPIADQSRGEVSKEAGVEGGRDEVRLMR
jgi:hypothetical protein